VDGVVIDTLSAMSSLGQIFRAEVPANLFGDVSLTWTSSDQYGNTGSSAPVNYTRTAGGATVPYGGGSQSAGGSFPLLEALSIPFPGSDLYLRGSGDAATAALLVITDASAPATPIAGLGTVNVAGNIIELVQGDTDGNGDFVHKVSISTVRASTCWPLPRASSSRFSERPPSSGRADESTAGPASFAEVGPVCTGARPSLSRSRRRSATWEHGSRVGAPKGLRPAAGGSMLEGR
jgi:hypothetical protein